MIFKISSEILILILYFLEILRVTRYVSRGAGPRFDRYCDYWPFFEAWDAIQKFELLKIGTLINWNKRLNDSKINLEK